MQLSFTRTSKAKTKAPVLEMVFCQPKMDDFLDEKNTSWGKWCFFYIPSYNIKIFEDPKFNHPSYDCGFLGFFPSIAGPKLYPDEAFLWRPLEVEVKTYGSQNLATSSCRQKNCHAKYHPSTFFWNELGGSLKTLELHFAKVIWPWCGFFSPVDVRRIC